MIAIVDYDAGNTRSVMHALDRLGADYILSDDRQKIRRADKVIFPGVGHAAQAMEALQNKDLVDTIKNLKQPILGICLGMQLFCSNSEEGNTDCLGIFDLQVKLFKPDSQDLFKKVPHMGWNSISHHGGSLFSDIGKDPYVFFVHSYYVPDSLYTVAESHYNHDFTAAIQKDNFFGVQFHPEKSSRVGAKILENFITNT